MLLAQGVALFDLRKRAGQVEVSCASGHSNDNLVHFYVSFCDQSIEEILACGDLAQVVNTRRYFVRFCIHSRGDSPSRCAKTRDNADAFA